MAKRFRSASTSILLRVWLRAPPSGANETSNFVGIEDSIGGSRRGAKGMDNDNNDTNDNDNNAIDENNNNAIDNSGGR